MVDTVIHNTLTTKENHYPNSGIYEDQAERLADTSLVTVDIYKHYIQRDGGGGNESEWMLLSVSPNTWANIAIGTSEILSASNVGSGADVFYQKLVQDLQFNGIKSENDRLAVALDAITHDIELTLTEANIVHQNISGVGTNTHSDIDTKLGNSVSHIAATAAHGASGSVVGTTNTQTLSAKTLTTPTIASFVNAGHDHSNAAGGGTVGHGVLTGVSRDQHHDESHAHSFHTGIGVDDHHAQSHSHASHSGIGTDDHHAQSHSIASHDTTATGTELNTLVNAGSNALHYHDADRARANHTGTQDIATVDGLTAGSVVFGGATGLLAQDNTNLYWDNTAKIFKIGSGTPGHITAGLYVKDDLEIDGAAYFDSITTYVGTSTFNAAIISASALRKNDNTYLAFGNANDCIMVYRTTQTPDALVLGIGADSNGMIICEAADISVDFGHALQSNPSLFIQSADATNPLQYVGFQHNQVDAKEIIGTGSQVTEHITPIELADDASFDLPDATSGFGTFQVGNSEERADISWDSNGVVDLIDWSANVVDTDTDTYFCIFDNGTSVRVRNRLGTAKKVIFSCNYWTP